MTRHDPQRVGRRERRHAAAAGRAAVDPGELVAEGAALLHADRREPLRRAEHAQGAVRQARRAARRSPTCSTGTPCGSRAAARSTAGSRRTSSTRASRTRASPRPAGFGFDPFPSPGFAGNVAKAKALHAQGRATANGMYTGPQVTMVADNTRPARTPPRSSRPTSRRSASSVKTISVTHSTMYTRFCNVPKNEPNICPNVGLAAGLPRAADRSSTSRSTARTSRRSTTRTGRS